VVRVKVSGGAMEGAKGGEGGGGGHLGVSENSCDGVRTLEYATAIATENVAPDAHFFRRLAG
jgi:hypothetical protein